MSINFMPGLLDPYAGGNNAGKLAREIGKMGQKLISAPTEGNICNRRNAKGEKIGIFDAQFCYTQGNHGDSLMDAMFTRGEDPLPFHVKPPASRGTVVNGVTAPSARSGRQVDRTR